MSETRTQYSASKCCTYRL